MHSSICSNENKYNEELGILFFHIIGTTKGTIFLSKLQQQISNFNSCYSKSSKGNVGNLLMWLLISIKLKMCRRNILFFRSRDMAIIVFLESTIIEYVGILSLKWIYLIVILF